MGRKTYEQLNKEISSLIHQQDQLTSAKLEVLNKSLKDSDCIAKLVALDNDSVKRLGRVIATHFDQLAKEARPTSSGSKKKAVSDQIKASATDEQVAVNEPEFTSLS